VSIPLLVVTLTPGALSLGTDLKAAQTVNLDGLTFPTT
jgi:hypothetical protein